MKRETELSRVQPLDPDGRPHESGKVVFISNSTSNATQDLSRFKRLADGAAAKSSKLAIVDCGGGVAEIGPLLTDTVRQVVRERVGMFPTDNVRVELSLLGEQAGLRGAIALAMQAAGT